MGFTQLLSGSLDVTRASRNQCFVPDTVGAQITWETVGIWAVPPWARFYPAPEKGGSAVCGSWGAARVGHWISLCTGGSLGTMPACVPSREQLSHEGSAAKIR